MSSKITAVPQEGILADSIITPGDILCRINGNVINDVLDYQYYSYDSRLLLELVSTDGKVKLVRVSKPDGADLGLIFENPLMDKERHCANKCIFCFIDQMPGGMRETLYYKDDDVRLSFLQGNYVTLTNLSKNDIERIIRLRISPINVSVHTLDPKLRRFMLGREENNAVSYVTMLAEAGITLNCQIVCCPGINDGRELKKTIEGFIRLGRSINSVSVVPVGLTKHREGLHKLRLFDKKLAKDTVHMVERYGKVCLKERGSRVFYCADELYITAELKIPPDSFYEDYPQLENGVGMMRLFITEFLDAMSKHGHTQTVLPEPPCGTIVTGSLAAPYLIKLLHVMERKYGTIIKYKVCPVKNEFFGGSVTVSGLITGKDIIKQLRGKELGSILLIPRNMLSRSEDVFLDDVTVDELSNALGLPVRVTGPGGRDLFEALAGSFKEKERCSV